MVGSGAAGLAAAFRLNQAGYRARLLERDERLGGRMHSVERDGCPFEEGPSGLTRGHTAILGIVGGSGLDYEGLDYEGLDYELVAASSKIGIADGSEIHCLHVCRIVAGMLGTRLVSAREQSQAFLDGTAAAGVRYRPLVHVTIAQREAPDTSRLLGLPGRRAPPASDRGVSRARQGPRTGARRQGRDLPRAGRTS